MGRSTPLLSVWGRGASSSGNEIQAAQLCQLHIVVAIGFTVALSVILAVVLDLNRRLLESLHVKPYSS